MTIIRIYNGLQCELAEYIGEDCNEAQQRLVADLQYNRLTLAHGDTIRVTDEDFSE